MMRFRPLSLIFVRTRKTNRDLIDDGRTSGSDETQDGTVDLYGRPASKHWTGGWKGALFIIAEQVAANLAYFGVPSNLVNYLTTIIHESNSSAAKNVGNWNGTGFIAPLLAAFVADSYSGRFLGAVFSSVIYFVGLAMLTVAGSVQTLRPPQCSSQDLNCRAPSVSQVTFLYCCLYVVILGAGGVQGTVVAFGADQFDDKEKHQKSSFFNWAYQTILIGSFISSTFFVYIQENVSVGLGWGISCAVQVLGTVILVMEVRLYRYHNPGGIPFIRIAQVVIASGRRGR